MTDDTTQNDKMAHVSSEPSVTELTAELRRCATITGSTARRDRVENTRFCRWAGQSEDGKKHATLQGDEKAFPWEGASDTRLFMADEVINGLVDLESSSFWRATAKVSPNNINDSVQSSVSNGILDWTMRTKLYNDLVRETELISQYKWTYGWAGAHISWQQTIGTEMQELTMEEVQNISAQAQPGTATADLYNLITNPDANDQAAEFFVSVFSDLKKSDAKKMIKSLRETGICERPVEKLVKSQPAVVALSPFDELVIPPETTDIQSARVVFRRCYMSEADVRQKVETDEWDEEWAEAVCNAAGKFSADADWTFALGSISKNAYQDRSTLIEVVYAYQRASDEDGRNGIWCTVFCPHVGDKWGKFEVLNYKHGLYPFVIWRSETVHRKIIESRGVPEVINTWQNEAKAQRDSIFDWTSISTIPPLEVPKTRGGKIQIGPAVQVPVVRSGEVAWMQPPEREPTIAFKLIESIEAQIDKYYGRPTEKVPPAVWQIKQQRIVNSWLHGWTDVFKQVLSLSMQYLPPEVLGRVTGMNHTVDQTEQDFDISVRFDVREMQTDLVTEKLTTITQLLGPADRAGVIDWSKLLPSMLRLVDPAIAQEVTLDRSSASQKLYDETQNEIALMALGNPPKIRELDPAAQTRLMFAQQIIQQNMKYQQMANSDESFAEALKKYTENLQFSVMEQQNAVTGRTGVKQ